MSKPYPYRSRWKATRDPNIPGSVWAGIAPGVKHPKTFKVRNRITGFFWSGKSSHTNFYDSEGMSWGTIKAAEAAVQKLVGKTSDSDYSIQRLDIRLKEMRQWDIVECRTRVTLMGEGLAIDTTENEVLNEIYKVNRTLGAVFARALDDGESQKITGLIHLTYYTSQIRDELYAMNMPANEHKVHRTSIEVNDNKWLMMLKLALPKVEQVVNVQEIREKIQGV